MSRSSLAVSTSGHLAALAWLILFASAVAPPLVTPPQSFELAMGQMPSPQVAQPVPPPEQVAQPVPPPVEQPVQPPPEQAVKSQPDTAPPVPPEPEKPVAAMEAPPAPAPEVPVQPAVEPPPKPVVKPPPKPKPVVRQREPEPEAMQYQPPLPQPPTPVYTPPAPVYTPAPPAPVYAPPAPVYAPAAAAPVYAPAPVYARPAAPPAPRPDLAASYRAMLSAWFESHKRYPDSARERGEQGNATIRFRVDRYGRLLDYGLLSTTGYPDLDSGITAMLSGAQLPPFPAGLELSQLDVSVTLHFSMSR